MKPPPDSINQQGTEPGAQKGFEADADSCLQPQAMRLVVHPGGKVQNYSPGAASAYTVQLQLKQANKQTGRSTGGQ
jgi:hypothetical protein